MKPKDIRSSIKSPKGKQVTSSKFKFVDIAENDSMIIFLIYFLEYNLLDKLKNMCVCREALLLAFDWDKFNYYL